MAHPFASDRHAGGTAAIALARLARRMTAMLLLALSGACAGIPVAELDALGAKVTQAPVHFPTFVADAERARMAYAAEAEIRRNARVVRVATPGGSGVQYFLERDDKARRQHLAIRGTVNDVNLSEDVDAAIRADGRAGVPLHAGFDRVAQAILEDVRPYLTRGYATHLTGHSLGGAAAAILGLKIADEGFSVARIVTFGQPRFTTVTGSTRLALLPLTRIIDENDVVPMLPPAIKTAPGVDPYDHVGPEIILLEGPRYAYVAGHDATRIAVGEFWRSINVANLSDHGIDRYVQRLRDKQRNAIQVPYNQREAFVAR